MLYYFNSEIRLFIVILPLKKAYKRTQVLQHKYEGCISHERYESYFAYLEDFAGHEEYKGHK